MKDQLIGVECCGVCDKKDRYCVGPPVVRETTDLDHDFALNSITFKAGKFGISVGSVEQILHDELSPKKCPVDTKNLNG